MKFLGEVLKLHLFGEVFSMIQFHQPESPGICELETYTFLQVVDNNHTIPAHKFEQKIVLRVWPMRISIS